jgi:hypothetical protein
MNVFMFIMILLVILIIMIILVICKKRIYKCLVKMGLR